MRRNRDNRRLTHQNQHDNLPRLLSPRTFLLRHAQVAIDSLGRLYRNGLASLMTAAVIGIALAMPSGLYLLLDNLHQLSGTWDGQASLSVFLDREIDNDRAGRLAEDLTAWPEIEAVQLVTPQQALQEFAGHSGFADVLGLLDDNPLPAVLVVRPAAGQNSPDAAKALQVRVAALPETDMAQLDLEWVQRLSAILEIARRGILMISVLLALAVLLVIGNTIRLEIQNRREEILVAKLIGATNAFVRRPFLYSGVCYGIFGALLAWLLVETGFWLLSGPVGKLAGLYQSDFKLATLPVTLLCLLLLGGIILGLLGSWLAVGRHVSAIEPT